LATTEGKTDLTWRTESASQGGGQQHQERRERPAEEDDALLDHHIEEVLGTFSDAARVRKPGADSEGQQLE